jgi:hypothetical protein
MRWPHINKEFHGREEIRAAVEQGRELWDYLVQTTHPGTIQVEGDTPRPAVHTSQSSGASATAAHT